MGPAEYQDIAAQSSMIHLHDSQMEPDIQNYRLPWAYSKHQTGMILGTWRMTHLTMLHISNYLSGIQVLRSSSHILWILVQFSVIRGLPTVALPWMLDLCSSRQTALWEQGLQAEYWVLLSPLLQILTTNELQCNQHKHFCSYTAQCFHYFIHPLYTSIHYTYIYIQYTLFFPSITRTLCITRTPYFSVFTNLLYRYRTPDV
jgi:hypothetical protein